MKIIVLMGSPNRKGSTGILVENFTKGAEEAGNTVEVIDVCHADIHPCTGCVKCGYEGPCVQKDDVNMIRKKLLASDMVVFATPLYYYGMTAQLKTVVDRFCAYNSSLNSRHLKSARNGARLWLRYARHDKAQQISPGSISVGPEFMNQCPEPFLKKILETILKKYLKQFFKKTWNNT